MIRLWTSRRLFIATVAIGCLTALGIVVKAEVAGAIATIVLAVCGANAAQAAAKSIKEGKDDPEA